MISKIEAVSLNVQEIEDVTYQNTCEYDGRTWRWSDNSDPTSFNSFLAEGDSFRLESTAPHIALHVNADKGCTPLVIVEEGYEWVPVYSRKLV